MGTQPSPGHVAHSMPDAGYGVDERRHKVSIWSRSPWHEIDRIGSADLPSGRFVAATTATSIGDLRIVGVCVPWKMAHVATGRRDRRPWQEHQDYVEALGEVLGLQPDLPLVVAGDFNIRLPRPAGPGVPPPIVYTRLDRALAGLDVLSEGIVPGIAHQDVDHIAVSAELRHDRVWAWPGEEAGVQLSDHSGLAAALRRSTPSTREDSAVT